MPDIDYSRIPYKEKRTHERCEKNAFYMPKCGEDSEWYTEYDANDFFGKPIAECAYTNHTGEDYDCRDCIHDGKPWDEEPCDSCCRTHSGFKRKE